MLGDVTVNIQDGGLGLLPLNVSGVHAKVGVCSAGTIGEVVSVSSPDELTAQFGTGPLTSALLDSLLAGSRRIYAVRASGDVAGTTSAVAATKTGGGSVAVTGAPLDAFDAIVEIVDPGAKNVATFRYSLDGGDNWSAKITVPTELTYAVPDTGLTLQFTEDVVPANSFKAGDRYTFTTTAPTASINSLTAALDALLSAAVEFDFIHVAGITDNSVWASLDARASTEEAGHRYHWYLCEARGPNAGETAAQWVTALGTLAASFSSTRVAVCAGRAELTDSRTGRQVERNVAGLVAGRISAVPVQRSAGRVDLGTLPAIVRLAPAGITDSQISSLDDLRYITARTYVGLAGFYVTNARVMAASISDFQYVELRRPMDKACRLVRQAALAFLQAEATDEGLNDLEARLTAPLETMIGVREIRGGQVVIPRDQDVVATGQVRAKVRISPVGIMREIEIDVAYQTA